MQEVLKTSNLLIGYKGQALMPAIDVSLNEGDIVALAGPNGSGKTTLFKTLSASLKPTPWLLDANEYKKGGGIHISSSKKGTFTAAAKKHGKSVQAFASQVLAHPENYSPAMRKKANFARNSAKWHGLGGNLLEDGGVKYGQPYYDYSEVGTPLTVNALFPEVTVVGDKFKAILPAGQGPRGAGSRPRGHRRRLAVGR